MRGMWVSILILFLLVAVLGGWILWLQKKPEPEQPTLADLDPQSVRHIVIEHDSEKMEFTRQSRPGRGWMMIRPFKAPADPYHMEQVTALPRQTSHARYRVEEKALAQFELAPPRVTVRLDETEFRFGIQNPIDFRRYVQVNGGPVHLIDDTLISLLNAPATSWIDTRLLPPSASIRALELPNRQITLSDKGAWMSSPKADDEALRELVTEWRNARAIQVSPFSGQTPGNAPVIRIRLENDTLEFILLQQEPEMILLRPDLKLRYHFYGNLGRRLLEPRSTEPPPAESPASP